MAIQTRTYSSSTDVVTGATILAAHLNTDLDKLYTLQNGNIDNDNISASANIAASKTVFGTYTAWTTYSPTIYKNDGVTAFTGTVGYSKYTQIAGTVIWRLTFVANDNQTPGTALYITTPVAPEYDATYGVHAGSGYLQYSSNTSAWPITVDVPGGTANRLRLLVGQAYNVGGQFTTFNGVGANLQFSFEVVYKAA